MLSRKFRMQWTSANQLVVIPSRVLLSERLASGERPKEAAEMGARKGTRATSTNLAVSARSQHHESYSAPKSVPTTRGASKRLQEPRPLVWAVALVSLCLLTQRIPIASSQQATGIDGPATDASTSATTLRVDEPELLTVEPIVVPVVEPTESGGNSASNSSANKLKPINFTLVDQTFESALSEDEVVKRWKHMDSQLQDGMKSILKMLFPQIVSISQDAKVSGDCSGGILKWILSLRNLRSWAIKMLDATGKPTSGVFEGSLTMFGNYRQCLSVRAPDEDEIEITDQFEEYFRGQYCVLHLKPWMPVKRPFYHLNSTIESLLRRNYKYYEKTLYDELAEIAVAFNFIDIRMDLCVPSTCTVADIQRVAELLSKKLEMRAKVMRCDIASRETNPFQNFDRATYLWLAVPLLLISLSLVSTILVFFVNTNRPAEGRRGESAASSSREPTQRTESRLATVLGCLSIGSALKDRLSAPGKLNGASQDDDHDTDSEPSGGQQALLNFHRKPLALYGLRNLFVFWFIIVQMTVELKYQYLRESLVLRNMIISYWPFQIIVNSAMLFESLIIITAFTYSYTCLESTLKDLVGYVVHKYVRLIPSIVTLIALTIVTPLLSIESPVWRNFVEEQSTVCKSTGYLDLFFLQNFIAYEKICLPHTWLFCVEMQLIVLSIPLVLLLKRTFLSTEDAVILLERARDKSGKPQASSLFRTNLGRLLRSKAGLASALLLLAGLLANFVAVFTNQLPPSWFYTFPDVAQKNYYFGQYLTKTWTHLAAFVIGLAAGHLCRSTLQLRSVKLLARQQSQQWPAPQPSPVPSGSVSQLQLAASGQSHGSTSTIMAMELSSQQTEDGSSETERQEVGSPMTRCHQALLSGSLQLAALVCMAAIIFSTFAWSTQEGPSAMVAALYDALSRLLWSLALVGLMVQLCLPDARTNRYSKLARLLCHPLCTFLGRLSFLAYLTSPYIHTFVLAVEEQSLFPSLFLIFHVIVGNIVITYVLAFLLAIVIEQPVRRLISRFVLGKRFCKQKINISTYYTNTSGTIPTISLPSKPGS